MAKRIAMPLGRSIRGVLADAVKFFGSHPEVICLVLGPRDTDVTVEGSTVTWEGEKMDFGAPVTVVRLAPAEGGVLNLAPAIEAVREFAPTAIVLNGGITPVQGVLWAQEAPQYDIQREGAVRLEGFNHTPSFRAGVDDEYTRLSAIQSSGRYPFAA